MGSWGHTQATQVQLKLGEALNSLRLTSGGAVAGGPGRGWGGEGVDVSLTFLQNLLARFGEASCDVNIKMEIVEKKRRVWRKSDRSGKQEKIVAKKRKTLRKDRNTSCHYAS